MEIQIDLIQPSPHPIRSSWDEDKMVELTDSIKEQGLIVPIKVRPTDNEHFEIVYGHRRAEACRRAGQDSIEALVEGVDDTDALIQALIENVQREDMQPMDKAAALQLILEQTGWSQSELARQGIMSRQAIGQYIELLRLPDDIQQHISSDYQHSGPQYRDRPLSPRHVLDSKPADDHQQEVLRKAARERLTAAETRKVAIAIAHAEDEAEREAILSTDPTDPAFDRLVRVRADIYRENERTQQRKREDDPREVKAFLESVRAFRAVCREAVAVVDYGKFSPEARRFAIRQLDQLLEDIQTLKRSLEV